MPDCNHFEELCSASLDSVLTRAEKRELDAHLETCPACAAYLEDMKMLRAAWGDLKEPLPEALHEGIMRGILAEAEKNAKPAEKARRIPAVFTMIAAAAACVMLVMSGAIGDLLGGMKMEIPASVGGSAAAGAASGGASDEAMYAFDAAGSARSSEVLDGEVPETAMADPQPKSADAEQEGGTSQGAVGDAPLGGSESTDLMTPFALAPGDDAGAQTQNAADALSVTLPSALQAHRFGFCYVAVGSGDPPVLEQASLLEKDGSTYYFRIDNNMSSLEKLRAQLQEAGYETAMRTDIGIAADADAGDSLLILSLGQ